MNNPFCGNAEMVPRFLRLGSDILQTQCIKVDLKKVLWCHHLHSSDLLKTNNKKKPTVNQSALGRCSLSHLKEALRVI